MFYVKTQLGEAVELIVAIQEDNVVTYCPGCGKEIAMDLTELLQSGDHDLYSTRVYCAQCSLEGMG